MLDLCPTDDYMLISCMLHPSRRRWSREWWKSGSNASPSSHCTTLLILFSYFYLPTFILSLSKHFITSRTPIYFFQVPAAPPHPEHWFLIPDSWLTAAPHLIIHETQKLETKVNCSSSLWFPWHTRPWEAISFLPFTFFFVRKHWWCTGGIKSWDLVFGHF